LTSPGGGVPVTFRGAAIAAAIVQERLRGRLMATAIGIRSSEIHHLADQSDGLPS
jgi:hypothetical protein